MLKNYYVTYGSAEYFPYKRGEFVVVQAKDMNEARKIYQLHYPNLGDGVLNCADMYEEAEWEENVKKYYEGILPSEVLRKNCITFEMNIYYNPTEIIQKSHDIIKDTHSRMMENDFQDIYNAIEDEENNKILYEWLEKAKAEEILSFVTVYKERIKFDVGETSECNMEYLAYKVLVSFEVEKLLEHIKK